MANKDPRFLSSDQQTLLRAALASNNPKQTTEPTTVSMNAIEKASDLVFDEPDALDGFDADDSLFYEGDTSFDLNNGDLSGSYHDKRKAEDDSPDSDEGDPKRREGDDKQAKKPGRKPLTTEPTTKRKAQNRAAQRAFRERKEKHLKDLETKVAEMTKESEADKQEKGILKAQVERLQAELKEYRARLSTDSSRGQGASVYRPNGHPGGFTFSFPEFGGPATNTTNSTNSASSRQTNAVNSVSPPANRSANASPTNAYSNSTSNNTLRHSSSDMQALAGLFSPGILAGAAAASNSPDYGFPRASESPVSQSLRYNSIGDSITRLNSESGRSATQSTTQSPSVSSLSQFGLSSSTTSPAVSSHPSPPKDNTNNGTGKLASISELTNSLDPGSIDWLAAQNGGQFDPVLFGDYRESQDAIVGDGDFNNGFFNDAFPFDFSSPLNLPDLNSPKATTTSSTVTKELSPTELQQRSNVAGARLLAEVQKASDGVDDSYGLPAKEAKPAATSACTRGWVPDPSAGPMLSANAIWHQLQSNKAFQEGAFDLDSLCDELKTKARCSESGMAVAQADVQETFQKLAGKTQQGEHSLVWDEGFINETIGKLGGNGVSSSTAGGAGEDGLGWGGFGLSNEQLSRGW